MNERSIVEPLSGTEVVEAVKHRVGQLLSRDCFLSPNMAYASFEATIHIRIKCKDVGHEPEINQVIKINGGEPMPETFKDPEEAALVETDDIEETMVAEPPNEVRVNSDQPVPVAVDDGNGRVEIKRVKYARAKPDRTDPNPAAGGAANVSLPDKE